MNIKSLNILCENVYVNRCQRSFEEILVDLDNIIDIAAHLTYEKYDDKILNGIEDIKQEILFDIWIDLTSKYRKFDIDYEVKSYILDIAEELLILRG